MAHISDPSAELSDLVGRNLRKIRTRRGLSLEKLAKISGVSRAMLGQIETCKSVPTISLLWKAANSLEVTFASLIDAGDSSRTFLLKLKDSKVLESGDGKFSSRALFPFEEGRKVEFYEIKIASGHVEKAEAHAAGTVENIVVSKGSVEILTEGEPPHLLNEGDSILFKADVPHVYRNPGSQEATVFMVVTYSEAVGI